MNSNNFIVGAIILFTLLVVGGIAVAFQRQTQTTSDIPQYQANEEAKPVAVISPASVDFGDITLADVKTADFTITNQGQAPLYLYDVKTSCGCTSATLTIDGQTSPVLSMHDNPSWTGIIQPGDTATVAVTYDAKAHPVNGAVERFVQIVSNDPVNTQLQLSIKANVSQ